MEPISDYELGDLVESVAYFGRIAKVVNTNQIKLPGEYDWPGPMNNEQAMITLSKLIRAYRESLGRKDIV